MDIKKFIKQKLSLRYFFESESFKRKINSLAEMVTNRYKNSENYKAIKTRLYWDSTSNNIACTDNDIIMINTNNKLVKDLDKTERINAILGLLAHELGHCLYTDFVVNKNFLSGIFDYSILSDDAKKIENTSYFVSLLKNIGNIIEDPYVEHRIISVYTGSFKRGIEFVVSVLQKDIEGRLDKADLFTYLLAQARNCLPEDIVNQYPCFAETQKIMDRLFIKPYPDMTERCNIVLEIINVVYDDFIKDKIKNDDDVKKMENNNGMSQKQSNGNGRGMANNTNNTSQQGNSSQNSSNSSSSNDNTQNGENGSQNQSDGQNNDNSESGESSSNNSDKNNMKGKNTPNNSQTAENSENQNDCSSGNMSGNDSEQDDNENGNENSKNADSSDNADNSENTEETNESEGTDETSNSDNKEDKGENSSDADNDGEEESSCDQQTAEDILNSVSKALSKDENVVDEYDKYIAREGAGDYHHNVTFEITKVKKGDKTEYQSLMRELKPLSKQTQNKVRDAVFQKRRSLTQKRQAHGSRLDISAYAKRRNDEDFNIFINSKKPNKNPLMAVSVVIDESDSMSSNNRYVSAKKAAILIEDFCRNLNVPVNIISHNVNYIGCDIGVYMKEYVHFDGPKSERYNLTRLYHSGRNRDGFPIRYALSKLKMRKEDFKLLIVISDGLPNDGDYQFPQAKADISDILKICKKSNVELLTFAIGSDVEKLKKLYGSERLVDCRDLQKFPKTIGNILAEKSKKVYH